MTDKEQLFRNLVGRHSDLIWHICSDYTLSAAWETEDAFQEVLCVLWRDLDKFRGESGEATWVYRVATNTMLAIKRKFSNRPQPEAPTDNRTEADPENYRELMQLVDSLEETDARIIHAHLDGFDQREIASMTGLAQPTVARRMARAKKWIREQYNKTK